MKTIADLKRRLARLEANQGRTSVTFKLIDGSFRTMTNKRLLEVFAEALPENGIRGYDYETIMFSVANNADHRLVELFKACVG